MKINLFQSKKRIIVIILCAVLLIGGTTTGIVLYNLDNTPAIKTVIRRKRKKKNDTQSVEELGEESGEKSLAADNQFSDEFDPEDWDVNLIKDQNNKPDTTGNSSKPSYEVDLDYVQPLPANQQMGFQIYHYNIDEWDKLTGKNQFNTFNYYYCGDILTLKRIKDAGGMAWLYIDDPFGGDPSLLEIPEQWKNQKELITDACKEAGLWDAVAGFHGEELTLGMTGEQFRIITKYLSDTYPGKRIYCVVSLYEVEGSAPDRNLDPITYRNYGYVTDIGYDWYDSNNYNDHNYYLNSLLKSIGRKNVRIWMFPTTYNRFGKVTADYMCESLEMCYKLLTDKLKEGYALGGLDCYTWKTWGGEDGLGRLLDKEIYGDQYSKVVDKMIDIGKRMHSNPYRYNEPVN